MYSRPQIAWQLGPESIQPTVATPGSSGYDLYLPRNERFFLEPGERRLIDTGVRLAIYTPGWEAQIRPRSGLAVKYGITVANSPGTIDADYRGTLCVPLIHLGQQAFGFQGGDRIAQLVFAPIAHPEVIAWRDDETTRGAGGFGSTGR